MYEGDTDGIISSVWSASMPEGIHN
ncbi:uncharacterized protein METZ01_LOCUS93339 [marine metagenome]|uniref:Uncharacterized protein n=1 Tax=marine metagenome TaxID=408172 RepID=A0A381VJE6_9ZZZZ